uniref:Tyrosine-protein phosphatase domain-containing protein n=1 Tax=Parastrongyloides trichosuri TaxID=131310 RepID=A0A0N4ZPV8_PARTI
MSLRHQTAHPSKANPENVNYTNLQKKDDDVEFNLKADQIFEEIYKGKEETVRDWMREIVKYPLTTDTCLMDENAPRNRFQNILLYDGNRVKIRDKSRGNDYYHASYVDGYDKCKRYIVAQAPFDDVTEFDFWRLVSSSKPSMIILLGNVNSEKDHFIPQFWKTERKDKKHYNEITVKTTDVISSKHWDTYAIELNDKAKVESKRKSHFYLLHYRVWMNDNVVPEYILDFRAHYQLKKAECEVKKMEGPIMIVCPTGTHRASFFAAMDIIMERINQEKRVGVRSTVQIIAQQRYGSFIFFEHYVNLIDTIIKHCISSNIIDLHLLAEAELKKKKNGDGKQKEE